MATPFVSFAAAVLEIGFNRKSATVYDVMTSTPAVATGTVSYGNGVYTAKKLNLSAFVDFKHIKEIKVFTEDESLDALNQNISSPKKSSLLQSSDTLTKKALRPKPTSRTRA